MEWLIRHSKERPNQQFLNELTFAQVEQRVRAIANRLITYVDEQDRVAIYAHNSVEMAIFFLALQWLGKEVFMMNTRLTKKEQLEQLSQLDISVVFSDEDSYISFSEVASGVENKVTLPVEVSDDEKMMIMNTSATTGKVKSVPIRWKQVKAHVEASKEALGTEERDSWLLVLPMYHVGGLCIVLRSLYNGTAVTILPKFDEVQIIKLIEQKQVNMASLVPTMLQRIINQIDQHCLRVVLLGGEFIPGSLVEKSVEKQIPIYKTYGMTETLSQSTTFSVLDHREKLSSVGSPLPGVEISIHEPNDDGVGEIWLSSPMLMEGYLNKPPIEGAFNTEDIGYLDQDGFLYILDRRKNIIISGGENIYPKEIEDVLYQHPAIDECAIIGREDQQWGKVPILYVVSSLTNEEIQQFLIERVARYKLPKEIIKLHSLPRNGVGKIAKKALK